MDRRSNQQQEEPVAPAGATTATTSTKNGHQQHRQSKRPREDVADDADVPQSYEEELVSESQHQHMSEAEAAAAIAETQNLCEILTTSSDDDEGNEAEREQQRQEEVVVGREQVPVGTRELAASTAAVLPPHVAARQLSTFDVHKVLQAHWKSIDEVEQPHGDVLRVTLSREQKERYYRLVNVTNWTRGGTVNVSSLAAGAAGEDELLQQAELQQQFRTPSDPWTATGPAQTDGEKGSGGVDVLIPLSLLDPAWLQSAGVGAGGVSERAGGILRGMEDDDDEEELLDVPSFLPQRPAATTTASTNTGNNNGEQSANRNDSNTGARGENNLNAPPNYTLRPHQLDGIRFLWRRLVYLPSKTVPAVGCILAHSMGLGKTCQTMVFLHLFHKYVNPKATTLLVVPKSVQPTWASEYNLWTQYFDERPTFESLRTESYKREARIQKLEEWYKQGGILCIGYEALSNLYKDVTKRRGEGTIQADFPVFHPRHYIDLVVCDEGHRLRSSGIQVLDALNALNPVRRMVMSGTPLQNHLMEYWNMIDFILPKYFAKRSFRNYFIRPIALSMHKDAKLEQVAVAKKRTFTLIKELEFYVHRRDNDILRRELPPLTELVVVVPMTEIQKYLYGIFLSCLRTQKEKNLLQAFSYSAKLCAHPELLFATTTSPGLDAVGNNDEEEEGDEEPLKALRHPAAGSPSSSNAYAKLLQRPINYEPQSGDSCKLSLAIEIILRAMERKESCLVFSLSTKLLDWFEIMLQQTGLHNQGNSSFIQYIRLDGSTSAADRERLIDRFQKGEHRVDVFLLSTKAGGVGVTLTQATRVIILDCSWNPADDRQAVGRAYRYSQTKPVFIYRLVCQDSIEHRVFDQKVGKEWLFQTVVDTNIMKRDQLRGPKLQEIFCMTGDSDYQKRLRPEETAQCCGRDEVLSSLCSKELFVGAQLYDSLLEEDPVKYGDEEARYYKEFLKRGGLWRTSMSSEQQASLGKRREAEEQEVRMQSRSLQSVLQALLNRRRSSGDGPGGTETSLMNRLEQLSGGSTQHPQHPGAATSPQNSRGSFFEAASAEELNPARRVLVMRKPVTGVGSSKDIPMTIDDDENEQEGVVAARDDDVDDIPPPPPEAVAARPEDGCGFGVAGVGRVAPRQPGPGDDEDDPMVID